MTTNRVRALLAALALLPAAAHAERYRVDLIVFADKSGTGGESPRTAQAPNVARAVEPYETQQLRAAGIEILPDELFGLTDAWSHLRNSRYHQPLLRVAWTQKDPPAERGVALRLHHGTPFAELTPAGSSTVYPLDGAVTLLAGRYLHVDADFAWTQHDGAGTLSSYRLREKRRVRRDELHHLDGARLGLLVRVQRADAPQAAPKKPPQR